LHDPITTISTIISIKIITNITKRRERGVAEGENRGGERDRQYRSGSPIVVVVVLVLESLLLPRSKVQKVLADRRSIETMTSHGGKGTEDELEGEYDHDFGAIARQDRPLARRKHCLSRASIDARASDPISSIGTS
jgi:hypothetical protein